MKAKKQETPRTNEYEVFTMALKKVLSMPHSALKVALNAEKARKRVSSRVSRAKD